MVKQFDFKPDEPLKLLTTMRELQIWMSQNSCNFLNYQVEGASISEGCILAPAGNSFDWIYTERGEETVIQRFMTESDAVQFAFEQIKEDGWAWSRMIGFLKEKTELAALLEILKERQTPYFDDAIPYGGVKDFRYRVYVQVKNAAVVSDVEAKYRKPVSR